MRSKEELISGLRSFAVSMRSIIIEANIKPSTIEIPLKTDKLSIAELTEGYDWLKTVFETQYALCKETKALLPEEQWEHYRQMDMDGTIEMRELKERLRSLRKAVINKQRPKIFRRSNVKEKSKAKDQGATTEGQDN